MVAVESLTPLDDFFLFVEGLFESSKGFMVVFIVAVLRVPASKMT